jgi:cyclooctatin synthase
MKARKYTPSKMALLGYLLRVRANPLALLAALAERGDLVEIALGPLCTHVVCNPDLVHDVLSRPQEFDKGGKLNDVLRGLLGNGLFTSAFEDHRQQRSLVQPGFHHDRLRAYATVMSDVAESIADSLRHGEAVDADVLMQTLTARITARTLFSTDLPEDSMAVVRNSIGPINQGVFLRTVDPTGLMQRLPLARNREYDLRRADLKTVVTRLISERRSDSRDHGDVLSMLLSVRDDHSVGLTDEEVYEQCLILLLAGTETTSTALTWALTMIDQHPHVRERLEREVDDVLNGSPAHFEDLPKLDYVRRVLTETLRLYSPAWMTSRTATTTAELGGVRIHRGSTVLLSSYTVQRNPVFFREPARFDPDRWSPERAKEINRHAMFPFGGGSRKCIGDTFAMFEATIVLATLVGRWRMRRQSAALPKPKPMAILASGRVPMRLEARRTRLGK